MTQIAIDGPAGSGKSTVAKILARKLGYIYLDTGAMYRAVTYHALLKNIDLACESALRNLVDDIVISFEGERVLVNGLDCTDAIRTPEVTKNVSKVAMDAYVRQQMVARQQTIAGEQSVIMDGRDIGTHVLPKAPYKFFLVASSRERARRRLIDFNANGYQMSLDEMVEDIERRDKLDSEREHAPLKQAHDAILIDTTQLDIEGVVLKIMSYIHLDEKSVSS